MQRPPALGSAAGQRQRLAQHQPRRQGATPLVDLEPADHIEAARRGKRLGIAPAPERDGTAAGGVIGDLQAQVLAGLAHRLDGPQVGSRHEQVDSRVAEPARLEALQLPGQLDRDLAHRQHRIDAVAAAEVARLEVLLGVAAERLGEGL